MCVLGFYWSEGLQCPLALYRSPLLGNPISVTCRPSRFRWRQITHGTFLYLITSFLLNIYYKRSQKTAKANFLILQRNRVIISPQRNEIVRGNDCPFTPMVLKHKKTQKELIDL